MQRKRKNKLAGLGEERYWKSERQKEYAQNPKSKFENRITITQNPKRFDQICKHQCKDQVFVQKIAL